MGTKEAFEMLGAYLTDPSVLFTPSTEYREIELPTGHTAVLKALSVDEFDQINTLYQRYGGTPDDPHGNLFTVCSIVLCLVHPETKKRLLSDTDVPRIRGEMPFSVFRALVQAFDELHGTTSDEDPDPVKKPSSDFPDTENSSIE